MASDSKLRDPRVEPIEPDPPSSNAYLHRAARLAVLLAIPAFTQTGDLPKLRGPSGSGVRIERSVVRRAAPRAAPEAASRRSDYNPGHDRR